MKSEVAITTYPKKLLLLAVVILLVSIHGYFIQGTADLTGLLIASFCSLALYLSLEKVVATFSKEAGTLIVISQYPLKKSVSTIALADIIDLKVVKGFGNTGAFWLMKVSTKDKSYPITSSGALSRKELDKKLTELNSYLSFS